jgi:hypothetical protein
MVKEKHATLGSAGSDTSNIADRDQMTAQALVPIRRTGPVAAFDKCRALADQINAMLLESGSEQLADKVMELQAYLECAAAVLKKM